MALTDRDLQPKADAETVFAHVAFFLSQKEPKTAQVYGRYWRRWLEFLGPVHVTQATAPHVQLYFKQRASQNGQAPRSALISPRVGRATLRNEFLALRKIYRVLAGRGHKIPNAPFEAMDLKFKEAPKVKRQTKMIPFEKVREIVNWPDIRTKEGVRDRALLALFFGGALRRGEVCGLRVGDVHETYAGELYLFLKSTKNGDEPRQALMEDAQEPLKRLVAQRLAEGGTEASPLFVAYFGEPSEPREKFLDPVTLYRWFKRYCSRAGLNPKEFSPHCARATAITKLLADKQDKQAIRQFSRHASTQMVDYYDKREFGVENSVAKKLRF